MATVWSNSAEVALNVNTTGWVNYTIRQIIDGAALLTRGEFIRVSFTAPTGNNVTIGSAYLGERAGNYSFVGTPLPIFVNGSPSFTIPAGETVVSDPIAFDSTTITGLVIAYRATAGNPLRGRSGAYAGWSVYYKNANDTSNPNPTGYTSWNTQSAITISLVETGIGGEDESQPVRVTQAPVLVLDTSPKRVRITQAPILVLSVPTYPVRVTQAPVLAAFLPKPPPLPRTFVPDTPLNEVIEFYTTITRAYDGSEQRMRLRDNPRSTLEILIPVESAQERQELYYFIEKYLKEPVTYAYYQYSEIVAAPALAGATRLDFNPKYVNIVSGDTLAVFDPQLENTYYLETVTVDATGADLAEPLPVNVGINWRVSGTGVFVLNTSANMSMYYRHGTVNLTLTSTDRRLVSNHNDAVLPMYNSVPISPMRHMAPADEVLTQDTRKLDNQTGRIGLYTNQIFTRMSGKRDFVVSRRDGINVFNKFLEYTGGMHKPFYLPTYFDDLALVAPPVAGQRVLRSRNVYYADMWKGGAWRALRIDTAAGIKYRTVSSVKLVYDGNGDAIECELTLDSALGSTPADNNVNLISYMPLCRFSDDRITLSHGAHDTTITASVAVVMK